MTSDLTTHSRHDPFEEAVSIERLLPSLRVAMSSNCTVIAQGLYTSLESAALLPAMLHGLWSDRVKALPLNATYTLLPFTQAEWASINRSLFTPAAIHQARDEARHRRYQEGRALASDFQHPDWEEGYAQHEADLHDRRLPGSSYLSLESVQPSGRINRYPRRVLGRHAIRGSRRIQWAPPRPQLLIPSPRLSADSDAAIEMLASADILLLNLQQTYGQRTLDLSRAVLTARGPRRPTLIITSRPSELAFFDYPDLRQQATTLTIGAPLVVPEVHTFLVGRERPQQERGYAFALRELQGTSPAHDYLVQLGVAAWWSANQTLSNEVTAEPAVRRFLSALDRHAIENDDIARDFTAFRRLLLAVIKDQTRIDARLHIITRQTLNHLNQASGDVAVILRSPASARVLAYELACQIECSPRELAAWGVHIGTANAFIDVRDIELSIVSGFSGVTTLDAMIGTRAKRVALICDPSEASLAVSSVDRLVPWIAATGEPTAVAKAIGHAAAKVAIPSHLADIVSIEGRYQPSPPAPSSTPAGQQGHRAPDVVMIFLDGTELVVEAGRRFDRFDAQRGRIRSVPASALKPGDEVVLIDDAAPFSEHLLATLDATGLRAQAALRQTWITLVETLVTSRGLKKTQIHRQLKEEGVDVDYQTVLGWTSSTIAPDRVPARWEHFCALARVVGVDLPSEQLREFYDAVRILRVRHRQAGRDLVRLIRAARFGRLDPISLERFERSFGIGASDLIAASRIVTIDTIWREE